MQRPYDYEKTKLVIREMADLLSLDLVEKGLVTDLIVLTIGYDIHNLKDERISSYYKGEIKTDHYGREIPRHVHGTINLKKYTASTKIITEAAVELFERIMDKNLLSRRMYVVANHVISEKDIPPENQMEQLDFFTDYTDYDKRKEEEEKALDREKRQQQAILAIKKRYGKNAIVKGMNLEDGVTAMERNKLIGGHRALNDKGDSNEN